MAFKVEAEFVKFFLKAILGRKIEFKSFTNSDKRLMKSFNRKVSIIVNEK